MSFAGKRIVVTGAGSGIGESAARMFLEQGAEVIAVQNRAPARYATSRVSMNLLDATSIRSACDAIPREIDILCHVAGMGADGNTPEDIIGVNVIGTRLLVEALEPRVAPGGCVLVTASISARNWRRDVELCKKLLAMESFDEVAPFWAALKREHQDSYLLSKAAQVVFTLGLANRHAGSGRRFNVVSPGSTDTPMLARALANANDSVRELMKNSSTISSPDDVAQVIVFVCSDAARVINGADIVADAGLMATFHCREYGI